MFFVILRINFICRGGGTGRHAVLRGQWAMLVRVRVPLSAHDISDLALKTWYIMVHYGPNGTLNGTLSITPQPGPWSSCQFSVITSQVIQVDKSLAYRTILLHPDSCHTKLLSNLHKPQGIGSADLLDIAAFLLQKK